MSGASHNEAVIHANNERLHLDAQIIHDGAKADEAEHTMSLKEAFHTHKKAIFWSMALSGALIMEGYDVVVVSLSYTPRGHYLTFSLRLGLSTAKRLSSNASVSPPPAVPTAMLFLLTGSLR